MKSFLYKEIINKTEELVLLTDADFICEYASQHFLDYFGKTETDIVGKRIYELLTPHKAKKELIEISKEFKLFVSGFKFSNNNRQHSIKLELIVFEQDSYYLFQVFKPNIVKDEQLKFISDTTLSMLNMTNEKDIYRFISEKLMELTTDCICAGFRYDKDSDKMEMMHYAGVGKYLDKIISIIGRNPIGMKFPLHPDARIILKTEQLQRGPDNLFVISNKWLPKFVADYLQKLLSIDKMYLMGMTNEAHFIGEIMIFVRKGGYIKHPSLIETIIKLTGLILKKLKTEIELAENRIRYKTLFDDDASVIMIIDPVTKKFNDVNNACCDFYGYSKEEFLNLYLYDIYVESLTADKLISDTFQNTKGYFLSRHILKTGKVKDVEEYTGIIKIAGNNYLYMRINDVSDLINDQKRLERGEAITNIGNWEIDLNTKDVFASEGAKKIYGIFKEILEYDDIKSSPLPEYRELLDKALYDLIHKSIPYDLKFKIMNANDKQIYDVRSIAVYDKERNHIYGSIQDITDIMRIENELYNAKEKAEESDRLKSAFLANLSHEIRTPMNAIKGFAELLKEGDFLDGELDEYVDIINTNSDQLLNLINDVLDISKIESGNLDFNFDVLCLDDFLLNLKKSYAIRCSKKNLQFNILAGSKKSFKTDSTRLNQVIDNLFSNALKFTQSGSITIGYTVDEEFIQLFVEDTGIGIEKDKQEKIFERFYQIEENYLGANDGTGLGLSISYAIINSLGGTIRVISEKGEGSRFEILFPSIEVNS